MKSLLLPLSKASVLPLSSTSCVAFLGLFVQHPCPIHLAAFLFSSLSVVTISVRSKLWLKVVAASLVAGLFLLVPMMDAHAAPAAAQTASVASAPIDYQRVAASVQQSGVTPRLPSVLVYSTSLVGPNRIFAVGGGNTNPDTNQPGYRVQITNSEYCLSGALSCIIAYARTAA